MAWPKRAMLTAPVMLLAACSSADVRPAVSGEPAALSGITSAHNRVRAGAQPPPVPALMPQVWSDTLAGVAQAWADGCRFQHSGGRYGENLFASAGMQVNGDAPVTSWASEAANYDYGQNTCSGTCGHYTQMVWRTSLTVGCGIRQCSQNSPFASFPNWTLVVCNYDPPGNSGGRPY